MNPYAQQDDRGTYEMTSPKQFDISNIPAPNVGMGDGMSAFYSEVSKSGTHRQDLKNFESYRYHPFKIACGHSIRMYHVSVTFTRYR